MIPSLHAELNINSTIPTMLSQLPVTAAIALLAHELNPSTDVNTFRFKCQYCSKGFIRG